MTMLRSFLSLILIATSLVAASQERPKIGLALSGGGAKSMTHIGVIRELEKMGIRPDYISGTSMGAVIGAMYAKGFSADQIEMLLTQLDWDAVLNNELPRYRFSYLDRRSSDRYFLTFDTDSNGIRLPDAINSGQYVQNTLTRLFQQSHADTNFSEFDIPFLCVGTDLVTGESIIYESGDLGHILRASSAFPSIFSPYEINGRLVVDGGIKNNIPIKILKDKGMDIIIASDAQANLHQREDLTNMITILEQVGSFPNMEYFEEQKQYADVIIHPPLEEYNIVSYEFTDTIIRMGEIETLKYAETLRQWGTETPLPPRRPPFPQPKIYIHEITISGEDQTSKNFIRSTIDIDERDTVEIEDIDAGIERLYGSNYYTEVDYRLYPIADSGYSMRVIVEESQQQEQLRLGVHYDDDFKIGVLLNVTVRNALIKNSKFSFDAVLSENPRGELVYIFERGFIPTLGFRVDFHQFDSRVYQDRQPVGEYTYTDFSSEIFLHSTLWDLYTIGGGVRLENIDISEPLLRSEVEESNTTYLNYFGFIDFDSHDRTYKPTSGFSLTGEFKIISEQVDFSTYLEPVSVVHLSYDQAYKFSDRWGARTRITGAATIGPDAPFAYSIFLGSLGENYTQNIFPFIGYRYMELFGRNALTARADLWYEAFDNHFFTAHVNVGKLEATVNDLFSSDVLLDGYGFSYGYKSPIGPLELFVTRSTNHSDLLTYVRLGFWF